MKRAASSSFRANPGEEQRMTRLLWVVLLALLLVVGCATQEVAQAPAPEPSGPAPEEQVREVMRSWLNAQIRGSMDDLAAVYADSAYLMTPGRQALSGRDAILAEYSRVLAESEIQVTYTGDEREIREDLFVERGRLVRSLRPRDGSQARAESLNLVTVMRREADGTWRIIWQIWNSNLPMPSA